MTLILDQNNQVIAVAADYIEALALLIGLMREDINNRYVKLTLLKV